MVILIVLLLSLGLWFTLAMCNAASVGDDIIERYENQRIMEEINDQR